MATKTTAIVVDDLDGSTDDVGTYQFAFNGVTYEIDLSASNFDRMAAAFGPFITAGRRLPKQPRAPRRQHGTTTGRTHTQEIRTWWWTTNWQELNLPRPRTGGVIPATVRDAYRAAH
ncbi:Nucleoid-associated protein Lsr2 [Micromonospora saelicesensis]|uniref:Nucleoid-associated protein Lsr2 n=1 Tax=Micromonospora saelicesensis TaxID=285676 RepID=A0A328NSQ8_9ACTN|nr:Lsr2 family protein [Micromonospora saelicesensis]RAO38645.1 Nucleoid-associated protein Lsr2 [Micromonospora saelicesensis]